VELGNQALEAAAELVEQADQAAGRKIREIGQVTKVSRRRHRGSAAVEDVRVAENQLHAGAWNSADSRAGLNRQRPRERAGGSQRYQASNRGALNLRERDV